MKFMKEIKKYVTPSVDVQSMVAEQVFATSLGSAGFEEAGENHLGEWEII